MNALVGIRSNATGIFSPTPKQRASVEETLQATAAELSQGNRSVEPIVCDVAKTDDIANCVRSALDKFGRIDTLINVAGVNIRQKAEAFTPEDYDFILDINLKGTEHTNRLGEIIPQIGC